MRFNCGYGCNGFGSILFTRLQEILYTDESYVRDYDRRYTRILSML